MSLKTIFSKSNDSIPFGFIVILTICGYFLNQINSIIQYESSIPTLEYSFSKKINHEKLDTLFVEISCVLTNISKDKGLRNIEITLAYPSEYYSKIFFRKPIIVSIAPNPILSHHNVENEDEDLNIYKIPIIHPQSSYTLKSEAVFINQKIILPKLYLGDTEEEIRVMEKSRYTWLLKKQMRFNIILLIITLIISLTTYYIYIKSKN